MGPKIYTTAALLLLAVLFPSALAWFGTDCKWTREDAIRCIERHVDADKNGWVSPQELRAARKKYSGSAAKWASTGLGWLQRNLNIGIDVSTKTTFKNCDADHNGKLTAEDFRHSAKTCLPTQTSLCLLKKVCDKADAHEKPGWGFW